MDKLTKYLIPTIYIGIIGVMVSCVMLVVSGVKSYLNEEESLKYTVDELFTSDIVPVVSTENDIIIKPFISDSVKVGKYYYDYQSDNEKQIASIIEFNNTYIQNTGIDYINNEEFDIVSVFDGEVISIEDNDIYGKVLTIKHNDNFKTVYSNISNILVSIGYKVSQGEIIATSSPSKIDTDNLSTLHFEVYYKDEIINPENIYNSSISQFQ